MLLGLQLPAILGAVHAVYPIGDLILLTLAVSGATILSRLIWVVPNAYAPFLLPVVRRLETPPTWQAVVTVGWSGMRGTVTLAAALSLPLMLPEGGD